MGLEYGKWGLRVMSSQLEIDDEEDTPNSLGESLDMGERDMSAALGPKLVHLPSMTFHGGQRTTRIAASIDLTHETDLNMDELYRRAIVGRNGGICYPAIEDSTFCQTLNVIPVFLCQCNVMLISKVARDVSRAEGIAAGNANQDPQGGMEAKADVVEL